MQSYEDRVAAVIEVFRPSAPMDDPTMFVGREDQLRALTRAILTPGAHVLLFGPRGVGKTSTAKMAVKRVAANRDVKFGQYRCSSRDTFEDIAAALLRCAGVDYAVTSFKTDDSGTGKISVKVPFVQTEIGGASTDSATHTPIYPVRITPGVLAEALAASAVVFLVDEFDRVGDTTARIAVAETIKSLADIASPVTIIVSGVGHEDEDLIGLHASIARNIVGVRLPRMTAEELSTIITKGTRRLGLQFDNDLVDTIVGLSEGLPYFTHLVAEHLAVLALEEQRPVSLGDLRRMADDILGAPYGETHLQVRAATAVYPPAQGSTALDAPTSTAAVRRLVLQLMSAQTTVTTHTLEGISDEIVQKCADGRMFLSLDADFGVQDVVVALDDIERLSGLVRREDDKYVFVDAFAKGFVRLWALSGRRLNELPLTIPEAR